MGLALLLVAMSLSRLTVDLEGNGRPATVSLVQGSRVVTVSITFPDRTRKPQRFRLSVCRLPVHLEPESFKYGKGFALVDEACDSFHFFWNRKTHHVNWWRE